MNRAWVRAVKNKPMREFEKAVNDAFDDEVHRVREHASRFAWAAVMLAAHRILGAGKCQLQRIGKMTVDLMNNALCAEELCSQLKDETGFDIYQRPATYEYEDDGAPRMISLDTFLRWTERGERGEPVECCGTVEDLLSAVGAVDEKGGTVNG